MSLPPFFLHFSNYMKYDTNCQELFLLGVDFNLYTVLRF
jgi:hypothetical protein